MIQYITLKNIIILYFVLMNIAGFLTMGLDKWKAKKNKWRIKERTLFLFSILGGSLGTWAGMYVFHHKTKHWYFVVGMPLIFILQVAIAIYLIVIR